MNNRIDHVREALRNIDGLHDYQSEEGTTDESMLTVAIEAQVHATLALVEQQRATNLIALFRLEDQDAGDFSSAGFSYPHALVEIREALGL